MRRIKVHPSMVVLVPFYIFLGRGIEFLLIFLIVVFHEAAHIIAGRIFGLRFKEIMLTPVGIRAVIPNMNSISITKRVIVYLAGPVFNLAAGVIFSILGAENQAFSFIASANFIIGIFNLLPVLPLDAGNIFFQLFSKTKGVIASAEFMKKIGKYISISIIVIGVFQLILFGFNVSLLLIGIFIYKNNENEYFNKKTEFFKFIFGKKTRGFLPIKSAAIGNDMEFLDVIKHFNYDNYFMIYVNGRFVEQSEIFNLMLKYGANYKVCISKELNFP